MEEPVTQSVVKENGGLEPLALLLKATDKKDLLCAVTGAVWKCSKSFDNVKESVSITTVMGECFFKIININLTMHSLSLQVIGVNC